MVRKASDCSGGYSYSGAYFLCSRRYFIMGSSCTASGAYDRMAVASDFRQPPLIFLRGAYEKTGMIFCCNQVIIGM